MAAPVWSFPGGAPPIESTITYGNTYGWQRIHPTYSSPVEDTGLSLSYIEAGSPHQSAWIEATGSEFRVYYLAQPEGGDAEFLLDGMSLGRRRMSATFPQVEEARFPAPGPDAPHRFEIRTLDSGRVRILGVSVEKAAPGVDLQRAGLGGRAGGVPVEMPRGNLRRANLRRAAGLDYSGLRDQ